MICDISMNMCVQTHREYQLQFKSLPLPHILKKITISSDISSQKTYKLYMSLNILKYEPKF